MDPDRPADIYRRRAARAEAEAERLERVSRRISWGRLGALLAAVFCGLWIVLDAAAPALGPVLGAATAGAGFVALVIVHDRVIRRQRRRRALAAINRQGLARRERRWSELPPAPHPSIALTGEVLRAETAESSRGAAPADSGDRSPPDPAAASADAATGRPTASAAIGLTADRTAGHDGSPATAADRAELPPRVRDLGLFGPVSLARLLSTARSGPGRETLCRWLLLAAEPDEAAARQRAVAELAPAVDLRQDLELAGVVAGEEECERRPGPVAPAGDLEPFLAWAEAEPWLLRRRGVLLASRALPPLAWALGAAALAGGLPGALAALALVVNLGFTYLHKRRLDELLDRVSAGADELRGLAAALAVAATGRFATPKLAGITAALAADGEPACRWMDRLRRGVEIADARHGSFHVITQVLTLWDFHALARLERWQLAAGRRARGWLTALGELEALAALAALAHDQPGWAFPVLEPAGGGEAPVRLLARDLGHPLLADDERVGNDVELGPPGSFLLVTGSNMSGKSTLLRAIGINAVLAQAGGPVCAAEMRLPPVLLGTSVLVEDSLADGVSFFLAELLRLKQVVDLADRAERDGRVLLYLLDEVLRGTNSRERREAVRRVLAHLLARPAIGALSTHDLELTDAPEVARAARPVHFRETVLPAGTGGGPAMTFDYRLRPGPATTTNALRLLEAVGLGEAPEGGPWSS